MARRSSRTSAGPRGRAAARRGFTVVEGLIAAVILAVAMVAVAGSFSAAHQQASVSRTRSGAVNLARALMEEIASKPLLDPQGNELEGAPAGFHVRSGYDSVGDYGGYAEGAGTTRAVLDSSGAAIPGAEGCARSVAVQWLVNPDGPASADAGTDFAAVTVTVTPPNGPAVRVSQLVANAERR